MLVLFFSLKVLRVLSFHPLFTLSSQHFNPPYHNLRSSSSPLNTNLKHKPPQNTSPFLFFSLKGRSHIFILGGVALFISFQDQVFSSPNLVGSFFQNLLLLKNEFSLAFSWFLFEFFLVFFLFFIFGQEAFIYA